MTRLHDKVWIPQENHPEINFVGLLIGPRGNTLKSLEAEVCSTLTPVVYLSELLVLSFLAASVAGKALQCRELYSFIFYRSLA